MDLMKGLIKTSLIILAVIALCFGISAIINSNLTNRLTSAYERGYQEGESQGYQTGLQKGNQAGYQEGSKLAYSIAKDGYYGSSYGKDFYFAYDPTSEEVLKLLIESNVATATGILDYAEINGVRGAYVRVQIAREADKGMVYVYHLVAFETVDKGFVIIEPWSYRQINLELGKSYSQVNNQPSPGYDDRITQIKTVW
jgi:hypothetical protein